jgi:hypothetical protein
MTTMAWDKIHIFADMTSNKMIQGVQPFRMRKPDENEKRVYDKFYGSSANNMTQIHNIAKDGVAYEFLLFDPDSQSPGQFNKHRPAAEMIRLYISRTFITDDLADMMPSYCNFVEYVTESDDPPLNVSRSKRYQGRQLEPLTEGEDPGNRQHEGVHDDHHQKFTLPNHESIAMGEQNHGVKTCLILFDEAHKLYSKTNNENVSRKDATEMTVMIDNTDTLKPTPSLESAVYADNEVPPEEHDDHNQAKKIAPLDALFPKIRVPSSEGRQDNAVRQVRGRYQHVGPHSQDLPEGREPCQDRDDDGSTSPRRSPRPDNKSSPDYDAGASRRQGPDGSQDGITKCPSTWPAHFAAVTTHSFLRKQGQAAVHLPDRSCPLHTLV